MSVEEGRRKGDNARERFERKKANVRLGCALGANRRSCGRDSKAFGLRKVEGEPGKSKSSPGKERIIGGEGGEIRVRR